MTRVAIIGANGRMGRAVEGASTAQLEVVARVVRANDVDASSCASLRDCDVDIDVVIDFSSPEKCCEVAKWCAEHGVPLVSGTTGFTAEQLETIERAAESTALLLASNFSVGVNLLERLVELAARSAPGWDIEVFEAHHRNKIDAPSGTALTLGRAAARGRDSALEDVAVWAREGRTGARTDEEIGFQVVRGGTVVGEHTVFLLGEGERIELTHRATDRAIFARGAVRAAAWLVGKPAGRYAMADVLFG